MTIPPVGAGSLSGALPLPGVAEGLREAGSGTAAPPRSATSRRDTPSRSLAASYRQHPAIPERERAAGAGQDWAVTWGGVCKQEFGRLWNDVNKTLANPMNGKEFLRYLSKRCDEECEQGRGTPVDPYKRIVEFEFDIDTSLGKEAVRVWRLLAQSGVMFLRMAPAQNSREARDRLIGVMQNGERRSITSRWRITRRQSADPVIEHALIHYDPSEAIGHWQRRQKEFAELHKKWNAARGTKRNGGEFLRYMSALCDQRLAISKFRQIDPPDGEVLEFEIELEGVGGITVWRMVENGTVQLRLAPRVRGLQQQAGTLPSAERMLLQRMRCDVASNAPHKRKAREAVGPAVFPMDKKHALAEWKDNAESFERERAMWNATRSARHGGAVFLQHLSALCDAQLALGNAVQVDESGYIFQFTIRVEGAGEIAVWRAMGYSGLVHLRKAPVLRDHDDPRAYEKACIALQLQMREHMETSFGAEGVIPRTQFSGIKARSLWKCRRVQAQFETDWQAWSDACGRPRSGGEFLQHVSRLCDEQDLLNRRDPIDLKSGIDEYRICTYPGAPEIRIWRLVPRKDVVLLRKAPVPPHDTDDDDAAVKYEREKEVLIGDMRRAAAASRRACQDSSDPAPGGNET